MILLQMNLLLTKEFNLGYTLYDVKL